MKIILKIFAIFVALCTVATCSGGVPPLPREEVPDIAVLDENSTLLTEKICSGDINQFEFRVRTTDYWKAESKAVWISLSRTSGEDRTKITLRIDSNTDSEPRYGEVVFTNAITGTTLTLKITQAVSQRVFPKVPRDMMLFYCGTPSLRGNYCTEDFFMHYLLSDDPSPRYLFDGVLLLEIWTDGDKSGSFMGRGYAGRYSTKNQILSLLDNWINRVLRNLDSAVAKAKQKAPTNMQKEKVVLMVPWIPYTSDCDYWGTVEGYRTDWSSWSASFDLYKWLIRKMMDDFNSAAYRNLELAGFYWPMEDAELSAGHLSEMADFIHGLNKQFYFIPYYSESFVGWLYSCWQDYGFDHCYLQPNYYFYDVPREQVSTACGYANRYGMDMEMEFDPQAYGPEKLDAYITLFEENGIFKNKNLAYYQSGQGFVWLKNNSHDQYKRLADHIAERHIEVYDK